MNIHNFVRGYLYPFIYDLVTAAHGSDSDVSGIYNFISNLLDFDITGLAEPLLWPAMGLWFTIKYALSEIARGFTDVADFVNRYVIPGWNTIVSDVSYFFRWLDSAGGWAWQIATNVFNQYIRPYLSPISFAQWLLSNGAQLLSSLISNPETFFWNRVYPIVSGYFAPYAAAVNWLLGLYHLAADFIIRFAQDPSSYVLNLAHGLFDALIQPFTPLLSFLSWWQQHGQNTLLRLVNDPAGFVFSVIEPHVLAWLVNLVDENW